MRATLWMLKLRWNAISPKLHVPKAPQCYRLTVKTPSCPPLLELVATTRASSRLKISSSVGAATALNLLKDIENGDDPWGAGVGLRDSEPDWFTPDFPRAVPPDDKKLTSTGEDKIHWYGSAQRGLPIVSIRQNPFHLKRKKEDNITNNLRSESPRMWSADGEDRMYSAVAGGNGNQADILKNEDFQKCGRRCKSTTLLDENESASSCSSK